jgi:2'-5' RNA ligase
MAGYRRYIDDPRDIARLEGQRFVVLRACGAIAEIYAQLRAEFQQRFAAHDVSYPAAAHVTLTGFPRGAPLDRVRALVAEWAKTIVPLTLEVEQLAVFPPPYQIVYVRLEKTTSLFHALVSLETHAQEAGLGDVTAVPHDQWVFHMSLAYCGRLPPGIWADVERAVATMRVPAASCIVDEAEIVSFDEGRETLAGSYQLLGREEDALL